MSTIAVQDQIELSGHLATYDVTLACLLSTLGFRLRCKQGVEIEMNGQAVISLVDKNEGRLDDLSRERFTFIAEPISHPYWGNLDIFTMQMLHKFCKLNQKHGRGQLEPHEAPIFAKLNQRVGSSVTEKLFWHVQGLYDHITNWNVMCQTVNELRKNPFLTFSERLSSGKLAWVANPLDLEPATQRRAERFLREERTAPIQVRGHSITRR